MITRACCDRKYAERDGRGIQDIGSGLSIFTG
jgi:hypothetical protein